MPRNTRNPVASASPAARPQPRRAAVRWAALGLSAWALAGCLGGAGDQAAGPTSPSVAATAPVTTTTAAPTTSSPGSVSAPGGSSVSGLRPPVSTLPGMPPVADPSNIYSAAGAGGLSPVAAKARPVVYVPSAATRGRGTVEVIDQATMEVVDRFDAGQLAQHVVPSWDLTTLYVNASAANRLVPIDPVTAKPGTPIPVARPYNLYFTPDGTTAVVQNEQHDQLDYYDPHTWQLRRSVPATCKGNNHADWSADGRYFLVTCEFSGDLLKVDTVTGDVVGKLALPPGSMPQDIRLVPDGSKFYVADMQHDGVYIVDGDSLSVTGTIPTDRGAHGIYPSRDARFLYVTNRGRHMNEEGGRSHDGQGSVAVVDPATDKVVTTWPIPGGGSPDMGGVSADGSRLWLSGRYDNMVYVFDTATGALIKKIPTVAEPHGLAVWPQPGRYSLGHTGNMR